MDLTHVLHMKGGVGEESYANNSLLQRKVLSLTKPLRDEAITSLYRNSLPTSLAIADLGCSCGPNTFMVISESIKVVEKLCQEMNHKSPEYNIFLNDLPGNDFNTIFQSLDTFMKNLRNEMGTEMDHCYFFGAPGSFYDRLFPDKSIHFIHSSYSLQFLSKVPEGVENNKGNIYLSSTSPSKVVKAYYDQYKRDFSHFLKCRAQELVEGGRLVVTVLGRQSEESTSKDSCYIWELMATDLKDMVSQGIIEEEKVNSFNMPVYYPHSSEVKSEILNEGSFDINELDVSQLNFYEIDNGFSTAQCTRAVAEPLLVGHFGESVAKEAFNRFSKNVTDHMPKEETKVTNFTMVLTKKP